MNQIESVAKILYEQNGKNKKNKKSNILEQ